MLLGSTNQVGAISRACRMHEMRNAYTVLANLEGRDYLEDPDADERILFICLRNGTSDGLLRTQQ
jgi:hypothetical protein